MLEIGGSLLSDRAKGVLLGLMASGAWGTVFLCARYLTDTLHIDPLLLTAARFTLSGIALVAYGLITGQGHRLLAGAEDAPKFLLLGLLGVVGLGVSVFTSMQYTYSVNGVLLMNSNGIFIAALAFLVGEKVPPLRLVGLTVGIVGCALVVGGWGGPRWGGINDVLGGIVALGGALSWALYTLLGKASVHRWGGVVATTWAICLGSVVMCAIVVGRGTEIVLPGVALWLVLYVALIPTACGFVWWYAALEHVPANLIGPLQYIAPVFGILLGWVLLKEPIESSFAVGAALVFVGVWVATRCETSPN